MSKNDKELAVEIVKSYIEASANLKHPNGNSKEIMNPGAVLQFIEHAYQVLKSLDQK